MASVHAELVYADLANTLVQSIVSPMLFAQSIYDCPWATLYRISPASLGIRILYNLTAECVCSPTLLHDVSEKPYWLILYTISLALPQLNLVLEKVRSYQVVGIAACGTNTPLQTVHPSHLSA